MADREDNVYRAKLAEQAERYDGLYWLTWVFAYQCPKYFLFQMSKFFDLRRLRSWMSIAQVHKFKGWVPNAFV